MERARFQSLMVHEREGEVVQGKIGNLHKDSMVCLKSIFVIAVVWPIESSRLKVEVERINAKKIFWGGRIWCMIC